MVLIAKGAATVIDVELVDKVSIDSPRYFMGLKARVGDNSAVLEVTDTSEFPDRYQRFTVTEGTDFTLFEGMYKLKFFEVADGGDDPDIDDTAIYTGVAHITATEGEISQYSNTQEAKVYEG